MYSKIISLFPASWEDLSLNQKTFAGFAVLFFFMTLGSISTVFFTVNSALDHHEKKEIETRTNLVAEKILSNLDDLKKTTKHWAQQYDCIRFLAGTNPTYPQINITPNILSSQNISAFVFLKADGSTFFSVMRTSKDVLIFPAKKEFLNVIQTNLCSSPEKETTLETFTEIIPIKNQLYLASCQPISNTKEEDPQGWLWGFRRLDQSYIASLGKKLDLEVSLQPWTEDLPALKWLKAIEKKNINAPSQIERLRCIEHLRSQSSLMFERKEKIVELRLLNNKMQAFPVLLVSAKKWELKNSQYGIILILFLGHGIMAAIAFFLTLGFLNYNILKPIAKLATRVVSQSSPEIVKQIKTKNEMRRLHLLVQNAFDFCRENETFLQTTLDTLKVGVALITANEHTLLRINHYGADLLGLPSEQLIGQPYTGFFSRPPSNSKSQISSSDGSSRTAITSVSPILYQGTELLITTFLDISELERTRALLEESEKRYRTIFMKSGTGIFISDKDSKILQSNDQFIRLAGREKTAEIEGREWPIFFHPEDVGQMLKYHTRRMNGKKAPESYVTRLRRPTGEIRHVLLNASLIPDTDLAVASLFDISAQKETERQLAEIAFIDPLTNLPNRAGVQMNLETKLQNKLENLAVFFIDIDDFKLLNDSLGHERGDDILRQVANRLSNTLKGAQKQVGRVSGDEFLVVTSLTAQQDAIRLAKDILHLFTSPVIIDEIEIFLGASIGIALAPDHSQNAEQLIIFADLAMHDAKRTGKNTFRLYTQELSFNAKTQVKIETELRNALANGDVQPFFQPIVSLHNNSIIGTETLARWYGNDGTVISPTVFIPVAERTGMITDLDLMILHQASQHLKTWEAQGLKEIYISSNLSGRHFQRKTIVQSIRAVIDRYGLRPDQLNLELTETIYMEHLEQVKKQIEELSAIGLKTSLDDFGTGYSSLSYLQSIPFHTLKIDRSFIWNLPDESAITLLKMIMGLAQATGLRTLAEGIETQEQLKIVSDLGCELGQGYLFSPPVPADAFAKLLKLEKLL